MFASIKKKFKLENITLELVAFYAYKTIYQNCDLSQDNSKIILFIMGCQRSGTSLMTRIFFRDVRAKIYRESSQLSSRDPFKLRLNPLPMVKKKISGDKARLVILKPLVESQNILTLLRYFPGSYAVWLFRNYKDVISSNLKQFGSENGIDDLRPIVNNDQNNWRSEKVTAYTRTTIQQFFSEEMGQYDAAALFWFARNQLFYDLQLDKNPRILMCRYEDLASAPEDIIKRIYYRVGLSYPKKNITKEVHERSIRKGRNVNLSPAIENLCDEMLDKLEASYSCKLS